MSIHHTPHTRSELAFLDDFRNVIRGFVSVKPSERLWLFASSLQSIYQASAFANNAPVMRDDYLAKQPPPNHGCSN